MTGLKHRQRESSDRIERNRDEERQKNQDEETPEKTYFSSLCQYGSAVYTSAQYYKLKCSSGKVEERMAKNRGTELSDNPE